MKNKKLILLIIFLFLLVNIALAIDRYYALELNHFEGIITYRGINLLAGRAPVMNDEGNYTIKVISFYNTVLVEGVFYVNRDGDFTLYVPYHNEAKEIVIFKGRERIFGYSVAAFADVCGDGTCQEHESFEDCPEDCISGMRDDYCDMVEDDICDSDCELDPDCIEVEVIEEEPSAEEPEEVVEYVQEKTENSWLFYIIILFFVLIVVFVVIFLSRHKAKKQKEEKLRDYINRNLEAGYDPEQIKKVLLNLGYKEKDVEKLFNKA